MVLLQAETAESSTATRLGDLALARGLWLLLLAQFLSFLPSSAASIFVPTIAADLGRSVALVGGLRSLGGVAALACGVLVAPLIDRVARARTIAGGLLLLAVAALLAAFGSLPSLALFYLLLGAAGAVYQPALQSAAADGHDSATGARAAAMLSAMGALAPMLGGPLLAATAGWVGWRGDYLASAVLITLVAISRARRSAAARRSGWPASVTGRPSAWCSSRRVPFRCCSARRSAPPSSSPGSPTSLRSWSRVSRHPRRWWEPCGGWAGCAFSSPISRPDG